MLYDVYLAGPFFTPEQKAVMAELKEILTSSGFSVADPQELNPVVKDLPPEERTPDLFSRIYNDNLKAMWSSSIIVAYIGEKDVGTAFELGFFRSKAVGNHAIITFSGEGQSTNLMLTQCSNKHLSSVQGFKDFIKAFRPLYKEAMNIKSGEHFSSVIKKMDELYFGPKMEASE